MSRTLRVLILEDSPADADLELHALRRAGYDPISERVETEKDYRDRLKQSPEVILADFTMPEFDSLRALEIMQELRLDIPFILVSGTIGEERAVQVMQRGATDYVMKDRLGRLGQAVTIAIERHDSHSRLRESERRVRELTEHIHQVLWTIDAKDSKVLYVSPAYETVWGRSCRSLLNNPQSFMDGVHPLDQEMMQREDAAMRQDGHLDAEFRILRPDGSVRWAWIRGYPVMEGARLARIVGVVEDVTHERRVATERDALLSRLQLHIDRMPLAYVLFDAEFRITDWNPSAERIFGYTKMEMLGMRPPYAKYVPESSWERGAEIRRRVRAGDMDAHSIDENLTKDRGTITCQWFNTPLFDGEGRFLGMLCLAQDVTEQKSLEAQLRQAQKMEAVGQLAGGIAHDFNNLLCAISGYTELSLDQTLATSPVNRYLLQLRKAADSATLLTRRLLAFTRKQVLQPEVLDVSEVVRGFEGMLRSLVREDIALRVTLDPKAGHVFVDRAHVEQVVMNLVVNARDATPKIGTISISTKAVSSAAGALPDTDVPEGNYVVLTVTDEGAGMTPEVQARLYEPFFTTKPEGEGTGLGLATVHGIVQQDRGYIRFRSRLGEGTTFRVYWPVVEAPLANAAPPRPTPLLAGGTETILVVEDNAMIRGAVVDLLRGRGYQVLEAGDGPEAISKADQHSGRIHALVSDVVMPFMHGPALADRLRRIRPDMHVMFVSAYAKELAEGGDVARLGAAFLAKPFHIEELLAKLRDLLRTHRSSMGTGSAVPPQ